MLWHHSYDVTAMSAMFANRLQNHRISPARSTWDSSRPYEEEVISESGGGGRATWTRMMRRKMIESENQNNFQMEKKKIRRMRTSLPFPFSNSLLSSANPFLRNCRLPMFCEGRSSIVSSTCFSRTEFLPSFPECWISQFSPRRLWPFEVRNRREGRQISCREQYNKRSASWSDFGSTKHVRCGANTIFLLA